MDLHLHTPASVDYQQAGVTALDMLKKAEERGLDIVAFTDHNSVRGYADLWREIEDLELIEYLGRLSPAESARLLEIRRLLDKMLLLPGFEFTATFGFHVLAIFPETTSIRLMEHLLMTLGVSEDRFGSGEVGATTDVLRAYEILDEHGALVIGAHVNSTHGVAMQGLRFGGQTKIAYTQDEHLHALEVTDLASGSRRSSAAFFSGAKTEYPRRMHCIQGSDAHRLDRDPNRETNLGVGDRPTEVVLPVATFAALKALFRSEAFDDTRPARPGGPLADLLHTAREKGQTAAQVFHERLSQARVGSVPVLRDIVAMANGSGGMVYIGVGTLDRRTIPGVADPEETIAEIRREIGELVQPPIDITIEEIAYDGKTILAVQVPDGGQKPYALAPGSIFVRIGDETRTATRDEIVAMVQGLTVAPTPIAEPMIAVQAAPVPAPPVFRSLAEARELASAQPDPEPVPESPEPGNERFATPAQAEAPRRPSFQPARREVDASEERAAPVERTASPSPRQRPAVKAQPAPPKREEAVEAPELTAEDGPLDDVAPRTGVEIVEHEDRDGVQTYTMRDLRNGSVTRGVTRDNARRLWLYAISQREGKELEEGHLRWKGDFGFWKVYRPHRGERRFNLAHRGPDGLRIFYGVSAEGMDAKWSGVVPQPRATA
ncbi:MAG: RNA-binding domain-containing protein [Thermomicrobiales bacterium]